MSKLYLIIVPVLTSLVVFLSSLVTISAGNVSVTEFFGNVNPEPLKPGIHFVVPFTQTHTISARENVITQKLQKIKAGGSVQLDEVDLQYSFSINSGFDTLYKTYTPFTVEQIHQSLVDQRVQSLVREVLADYTVDNLNEKIEDAIREITARIDAQFSTDDSPIKVSNFIITLIDFDDKVQDSINSKLVSLQLQQKATIDLETARTTAQKNEVLTQSLTDAVLIQEGIDACLKSGSCLLMPSPNGYGVNPILSAK